MRSQTSRRRRRSIAAAGVLGAAGVAAALVAGIPTAQASTLLGDDFEGGTGNWSKSGGSWSVVGDGTRVYRQTKADSEIARVFAGDAGWTDYAAQARVKPVALGGGLAGIAARAAGPTTMTRLVVLGGGRVELQSVKGSTVAVLGSATVADSAAWHTLRLEATGATVRGFVDGTPVGAGGPAAAAKGRVGLVTSRASAQFDDVTVTTLAGSAPTTVPPTAKPTTAPATKPPAVPSATPTRSATTAPTASAAWPAPTGNVKVSDTTDVTGTFDGKLQRFSGIGDGGQDESQPPMFELADGATLKNVIIGAPAGDGVHCTGSCSLVNVWWEDVGEDAATFKGGAGAAYLVDGGGARSASDKVFQHNGGGTLTIRNFGVSDFGKLYRSCGNCGTQHKRTVVLQNVTVTAPGKTLVGVNANYGDTATLTGITIVGDSSRKISVCDRFTGNDTGKEPPKIGSGPDGTTCRYSASDITYR